MWNTVFDKIGLDFRFKKVHQRGQKCDMLCLIELNWIFIFKKWIRILDSMFDSI